MADTNTPPQPTEATTDPAPKQPPTKRVETPEEKAAAAAAKLEKKRRDTLLGLCRAAKDIYVQVTLRNNTGRTPRQSEYISNYRSTVDSANYRYDVHQKIYTDLFKKYMHKILAMDEDVAWLSTEVISVQMGAGIKKLEKRNILIPLTQAYAAGIGLRSELEAEALEAEKAGNPNQAASIRDRFEYTLAEELLAYFAECILLAVTGDHDYERHVPRLKEVVAHYREAAHLDKNISSDNETNTKAAGSIGKLMGGGAPGIGSITAILGDITGIFGSSEFLEIAEQKLEALEELDKDGNASVSDVLGMIAGGAKDFEPIVNKAMESMKS